LADNEKKLNLADKREIPFSLKSDGYQFF